MTVPEACWESALTAISALIGLGLGVLWVARLLHTACARLLPVAALVTGWLLLATPPGRALVRGWPRV